MAEYFGIKNYERYQHYKHRNPPWIKLYYDLLDDDAFIALNIASRHHYMTLLLIAGRQNNRVLMDGSYLRKVMRLDAEPDLTMLFDYGFLIAIRKRGVSKKTQKPLSEYSSSETEYSSSEYLPEKVNGAGKLSSRQTLEIFEVTDTLRKWARKEHTPDPDFHLEEFKDYWRALKDKDLKSDWAAAYRNRLRYIRDNPTILSIEASMAMQTFLGETERE